MKFVRDISSKVNISDIIDNLTSTDANKPLSANQGKILKDLETLSASMLYVQSRLQDLTTNRNGLLGDNYNFSPFTFDPVELHGGGGSFLSSANQNGVFSDEYIPIDIEKRYRWSAWIKAGDEGGGNYDATASQLAGVALFDIDKLSISQQNSVKYPGSTDTTLAVDLNPGDPTITLTDATGWYNSTATLQRSFAWYGYANSYGYVYHDYTYTRNISPTSLWPAGGITGNVITLNNPWAGPALSAGDAVRNPQYGSNYKYFINITPAPQVWTKYESYIKKSTGDGIERLNDFRAGTVFMKYVFYTNRFNPTQNNIRYSDLAITATSSDNLEPATSTLQGVVSLEDQVMGAGKKTFTGGVVLAGSINKKLTTVSAATYTLTATDSIIAVPYTETGAVTLSLPSATTVWDATRSTGISYTIKDTGANAGTFAITLNRDGTDTIIDTATGQTSVTINSNGGVIKIMAISATEWAVL